jgi:predicted DNA-binding transcriptional regulator AlpA
MENKEQDFMNSDDVLKSPTGGNMQLINVKKVAAMLDICTRGVWRLVARGELPQPKPVGRRAKRWRLVDIQAYIRRIMGDPK